MQYQKQMSLVKSSRATNHKAITKAQDFGIRRKEKTHANHRHQNPQILR